MSSGSLRVRGSRPIHLRSRLIELEGIDGRGNAVGPTHRHALLYALIQAESASMCWSIDQMEQVHRKQHWQ